ncbi:MAG: pilus assembly FimT family protein [Planctomycetota bacterium]|jgi:prepilin-type N-terminal cleavage/methylation domain-containing protein
MTRSKSAFSLAELIIVVAIIGIMAMVAVPRLQFGALRKKKAETVASKIATGLRLTRRLAITNAAENTDGYQLAMQGGGPYTGYQIINSQTKEVVDTYSIDSEVSCKGDSQFEFGPLGTLLTGSGSILGVSSGGKSFTITVNSATGMVKNTEN